MVKGVGMPAAADKTFERRAALAGALIAVAILSESWAVLAAC
jgi:hypothetical protein